VLLSTRRSKATLCVTFTVVVVFGPMLSSMAAQEPKEAIVVPGLYQHGSCAPASFPSVLPMVNDVLDSAALARVLGDSGLRDPLTVSLRLGSLNSEPRVRVLGKPKSASIARRMAAVVLSAIRPVPADTPWAFRLRLEPGGAPTMSLSRSEFCPPAWKQGAVVRTQSYRMEEGQAVEMQRRLEEEARLRQMVIFRVLVQANGRAGDVIRVAASGDRRIDNQMQQIVTRGNYFPAKLDGAPVSAWLQVGWPR
jgi:TonB-like protein